MPYSALWITNRCRCSPPQPKAICNPAGTSATPASPTCPPGCRSPSAGTVSTCRFVIHRAEYGISYAGGVGCRDDPHRVHLADLGLRPTERFVDDYDFTAGWRLDLRLEQVRAAEAGRVYRRCTGGRRAGPPAGCGGPRAFTEYTQPHLVFGAVLRAAAMLQPLLDDDLAHPRRPPRRAGRPAAAAGPGALRPPGGQPSPGRAHREAAEGGMKVTVQVVLDGEDEATAVREVFALARGAVTA